MANDEMATATSALPHLKKMHPFKKFEDILENCSSCADSLRFSADRVLDSVSESLQKPQEISG
jgi:hypothetical protein